MSATFMANHGANCLDLQQHHNWKSAQMPLEYIGSSDPHLDKMASYVQGIPVASTSASTPPASTPVSTLASQSRPSEPTEFFETSEDQPSNKKMKTGENKDNENELSIGGNVYRFINCTGNINITINK